MNDHLAVGASSEGRTRMDPAIKARWVAALRSGEYEQGTRRVLNDGEGGWCCLGVLCDLYAIENGMEWQKPKYTGGLTLPVGGGDVYPAIEVRGWAAFHEDEHPVEIGGHRESVAAHNDGIDIPRRTFAEIADAIEAQL